MLWSLCEFLSLQKWHCGQTMVFQFSICQPSSYVQWIMLILYFVLVLYVCLKTTISMCCRGDGTWNHTILHHITGLLMYFHRITELGVPFKIKHKIMQVSRHLKHRQCEETSCIHTQLLTYKAVSGKYIRMSLSISIYMTGKYTCSEWELIAHLITYL